MLHNLTYDLLIWEFNFHLFIFKVDRSLSFALTLSPAGVFPKVLFGRIQSGSSGSQPVIDKLNQDHYSESTLLVSLPWHGPQD